MKDNMRELYNIIKNHYCSNPKMIFLFDVIVALANEKSLLKFDKVIELEMTNPFVDPLIVDLTYNYMGMPINMIYRVMII